MIPVLRTECVCVLASAMHHVIYDCVAWVLYACTFWCQRVFAAYWCKKKGIPGLGATGPFLRLLPQVDARVNGVLACMPQLAPRTQTHQPPAKNSKRRIRRPPQAGGQPMPPACMDPAQAVTSHLKASRTHPCAQLRDQSRIQNQTQSKASRARRLASNTFARKFKKR